MPDKTRVLHDATEVLVIMVAGALVINAAMLDEGNMLGRVRGKRLPRAAEKATMMAGLAAGEAARPFHLLPLSIRTHLSMQWHRSVPQYLAKTIRLLTLPIAHSCPTTTR